MDLRPTAPPVGELEATAQKLEEVGARLTAFHESTEGGRVRIEQIANKDWAAPTFAVARPSAAQPRALEPAHDPGRERLVAQIRSHPLAAVRQPVEMADARTPGEQPTSDPLADESGSVELAAARDGEEATPAVLGVAPVHFSAVEADLSADLHLDMDDAWLPRTDVVGPSPTGMMDVAMGEATLEAAHAEEGEPL